MCSTTCVTMAPQGTTRTTRSTLQALPALCAPRTLNVEATCFVVNMHFVSEFECAICGDGVCICCSNGMSASGVARADSCSGRGMWLL